jgi:hypothetical protein
MIALLGKRFCLTGNYYSSPQLIKRLAGNKTDTYGTVWLNRKEISKDLRKKNLKGELAACRKACNLREGQKTCFTSTVEVQGHMEAKTELQAVVKYYDTNGRCRQSVLI